MSRLSAHSLPCSSYHCLSFFQSRSPLSSSPLLASSGLPITSSGPPVVSSSPPVAGSSCSVASPSSSVVSSNSSVVSSSSSVVSFSLLLQAPVLLLWATVVISSCYDPCHQFLILLQPPVFQLFELSNLSLSLCYGLPFSLSRVPVSLSRVSVWRSLCSGFFIVSSRFQPMHTFIGMACFLCGLFCSHAPAFLDMELLNITRWWTPQVANVLHPLWLGLSNK